MCAQVCSHAHYRMLTLRMAPQVAAASLQYTTFSWNAALRRLAQMFVTHSTVPDRLDWTVPVASPHVPLGFHGSCNRAAGAYVVLRGALAPQADASALGNPAFYPSWLPDGVMVTASSAPFRRHDVCAAMLSCDQV